MSGYERLQEELQKRINKLGFGNLGLLTRFRYLDFEKIERLSVEDITCVGSIVEDIFRINELERKLQRNSQERIRLTFQRTTPLTISRESFLQYGQVGSNDVKVHISHTSPRIILGNADPISSDLLKPYYPLIKFLPRTSQNDLLHNLYFSINCRESSVEIPYEPVELIQSHDERRRL